MRIQMQQGDRSADLPSDVADDALEELIGLVRSSAYLHIELDDGVVVVSAHQRDMRSPR